MTISDHASVTRKELRNFGLITGALFVVLFGLLFPHLRQHAMPRWPWILCGSLWIAALAAPRSLTYVFKAWSALGSALGWVNSKIMLTLLFYVVIVPVGVLMRLAGRDVLAMKFDRNLESYRKVSRHAPPTSMDRPY